jgi:hypothetical protein
VCESLVATPMYPLICTSGIARWSLTVEVTR